MKTLYLECNMGAAGDMLTAALLELVDDKDAAVRQLNDMGIPGVRFEAVPSTKCGVTGTHMKVTVDGVEEQVMDVDEHNHAEPHPHMHDHHHDHVHSHALDEDWNHHHHAHEGEKHTHVHHEEHPHVHGDESHTKGHHEQPHDHAHGPMHSHRGMGEINDIIAGLHVSETVKRDASAIYEIIAQAESHVHGEPVDQIHFHEVGNMDAVADVSAAAFLMSLIRPDRVVVSPVATGFGQVKCAHGIIPVPAPATAHILQGMPAYAGWIKGELLTPTGAAILKYYADEFGNFPAMTLQRCGYGMGHKDFEAANCVRAFLGETLGSTDCVIELSCNVDDMTGEDIGHATEILLAHGARDAFVIPVLMKKSRPGHLITVITDDNHKEEMVRLLFRHTTTIGIRETSHPRYVLERHTQELDTAFGVIRRKVSQGYGVRREKFEYDDLSRAAEARGVSIEEVREKLRKQVTE